MKNLTEDEKRIVNEVMRGPFWTIYEEYIKEKTIELREAGDTALNENLSSVLVREQFIGGSKHLKYATVDFQNYVKTQNEKIQ